MEAGGDGAGGARQRAPLRRGRGAGDGGARGLLGGRGPSLSRTRRRGACTRGVRAALATVSLLQLGLFGYFVAPRLLRRRPGTTSGASSSGASTSGASRDDLNALLRQGVPDQNECLHGLQGSFFTPSDAVLQQVSHKLMSGTGFVWSRWGDGDMLAANENNELGAQMRSSLVALSTDPLAVVNVGVWWLCEPYLNESWLMDIGDTDIPRAAFHSFFYLPAGDPADSTRTMWRQHGVTGWSAAILRRKRTLVLVGPPHLRDIPLFKNSAFIDTFDPSHSLDVDRVDVWFRELTTQTDLLEPPPGAGADSPGVLCIVAAGSLGKILMARLLEFVHDRNWAIVDVGASLDGYVGVHSRDYNDPKEYCRKARENASEEEVRMWFATGLCEEMHSSPSEEEEEEEEEQEADAEEREEDYGDYEREGGRKKRRRFQS